MNMVSFANQFKTSQDAKKVIFTACQSGKLKLAFTCPSVISTSPQIFWWAELTSHFFCKLNSSKYFTCPLGKLRTEFTSPIAKSTSPGLSDTTFFVHCFNNLYAPQGWGGRGVGVGNMIFKAFLGWGGGWVRERIWMGVSEVKFHYTICMVSNNIVPWHLWEGNVYRKRHFTACKESSVR